MLTAYRPSTDQAHRTHFSTYLSVLLFYSLPLNVSAQNILIFLEFLVKNHLSPRVVRNYFASISSLAKFYHMDSSDLSHPAVFRFLRSLSINSTFRPTPRGVFSIRIMYDISKACDSLQDPILYRAIFLTAFYAFLRLSNIAPHSIRQFSQSKHFLRKDLIFAAPGAHLLIKWTKTIQDPNSSHMIQLPEVDNFYLCPVRALRALLQSRPLPSTAPLFATSYHPHLQVIDTHVRDALKVVLNILNISPVGHGFHSFRRSGATFAFDNNIPLQNIMAHGLWRSSYVWTYLQNASQAPSIIPSTFSSVIPTFF